MSAATAQDQLTEWPELDLPEQETTRSRPRLHWAPPLTMLAVVLAGILAPLVRAPNFYYWDDTASASVSAWRHIGDSLLAGHLPLLDLDLWRGGNYAAEAAFGLYNPLLLALYAGTKPIDDLIVVAVVFKAFFFLTMALGAYLVSRQYGARPWIAAIVGTMLPMSGFTLWMDGAAWVTGLTVTALTPWVWYTAKRAAEGRGSLGWAVVAGYLCASAGNPYGLVSTALVFAAVIVEALVRRRFRPARGLVVAGAAVGLLSVATYLPFVLTSSVSFRAGSGMANDEFLSPNLTDLLGMSSPSFQPSIKFYTWSMLTYPATYLSWLVVPLLPWLRWSTLRDRGRLLAGPYLFGGLYLLLLIGPSQIWFFRWPLRLIPYFFLAVVIVFAVVLSAGLARSRVKLRLALSAAAVGIGFWTAWSDVPQQWDRHAASALVVAVLVGLVLWAARRSHRLMALVAMGGTLVVLAVQLAWMPINYNVISYGFPRSEKDMQARFADYKPGLTVQIASIDLAVAANDPDGVYRDVLFGSMYAAAGVESTTAYSGVGFTAFDHTLCMKYQGAACADAWKTLWLKPAGSQVVLADLLRAQRVVVERTLLDTRQATPPPGWRLASSTTYVDVWERTEPLPWPQGRVSDTSGPLTVVSDQRTGDVGERVQVQRTGSGAARVTFARLAWPGYTASIDGHPAAVRQGPAGLLQVDVPDGVGGGTLTVSWAPPGEKISIGAAGLGLLATVLLVGTELVNRRRRRTRSAALDDRLDDHLDDHELDDELDAHDPVGSAGGREGLRRGTWEH